MTYGIAKVFCRLFKVHCRRRDPARDHTIGESGNHVGLEGHSRDVRIDRSQHGGAGGVSADADDDIRTEIRRACCARCKMARGRSKKVLRRVVEADAIQRADFDQLERKSGRRNQAVLDAARGADEQNFGVVAGLEFLGDGEGRDDVSARASACENDAHAVTINRRSMR